MAKRYSEAEYNAMTDSVLVTTIDAMTKKEASDYLPPKVKIRYFVVKYGKDLSDSIKGSGIFFSVAVAQNMLESTFGKSDLAQYHNNFGGVKALKGYPSVLADTNEVRNGKTVAIKDYFTKFPTPKASFDNYVAIVKKVAATAGRAITAEDQVLLIAQGDGTYMNTITKKPIGYTTTPASSYLYAMQGNLNRIRDMYKVGKITW